MQPNRRPNVTIHIVCLHCEIYFFIDFIVTYLLTKIFHFHVCTLRGCEILNKKRRRIKKPRDTCLLKIQKRKFPINLQHKMQIWYNKLPSFTSTVNTQPTPHFEKKKKKTFSTWCEDLIEDDSIHFPTTLFI